MTIRDIAQRLGIAVSTVSKGLNGAPDVSAETRQLVLDTAVEMGYAAKRARRQAQPKVCVLVENMEYANIGQFGYEIVAGFRLAAAARGWAVDVLPTTPEAQARTKYGSLLLEGGYGGAFILGLTPQEHTCVRWPALARPQCCWTTAFPTPASDMWAPTVGRAWSSACGIWPDWNIGKSPF